MIILRSLVKIITILLFITLSSSNGNHLNAQDGKALFSQNCASCHAVNKKLTGPALAGVEDRWPEKKNLYAWIKNSAAFLKTGDPYATKLYEEYNKTAMNNFPGLADADIDAILAYNKFKDKNFTVLGVSLDSNKDNWLKAIKDDNLKWAHVSDLQQWFLSGGLAIGLLA